ncbi:MAG: hypothetical protein HZC51_14180 [Nitrospirae bacterium]|nr:hypothetical protein [Nitrospirota bacterium]
MKTKMIAVLMFLLLAGTASAYEEDGGTWSVGLAGGGAFALGVESGALTGSEPITNADFDNTIAYSGNVMYRFPSGFTARVEVQHMDLDLGVDWAGSVGSLSTTPVMLLVGYQGMPNEDGIPVDSGFTGHGELGGGISFNNFDKGSGMDVVDTLVGGTSDVKIKNGYAFEFGVGGDYFFNRNFSMNLDLRYLLNRAETTGWNPNLVWVGGGPVRISKVVADTGQAMLGVRYWFK